jgi:hypothetical protein
MKQQNKSQVTIQAFELAEKPWVRSISLAWYILAPFTLQWLLLDSSTPAGRLILGVADLFWLFIMTAFITYLDNRLVVPVRLDFLPGRMVNVTTVSVWLGFVIVPVIGLLLQPGREMSPLATAYLVMGLANLLFKLNRRIAFRRWLEVSSIPLDQMKTVYDVRMIQEAGLYALTVQPWWIMRIEAWESGCDIDIFELEGQSLVEISPGKKWRKHSSNLEFAVRWLERRLKQPEASAG